jgi:hypothetical protein
MTVSMAGAQLIGTKGALQISFAYSAIVRSEENQPTLAVLRTLERSQRFRSRQTWSIFICVVLRSRADHEIIVMGERVDEAAVTRGVVGREHAGSDFVERFAQDRQAAMCSVESMPRARAASISVAVKRGPPTRGQRRDGHTYPNYQASWRATSRTIRLGLSSRLED